MNSQRIAVIGGSGFIGGVLMRGLLAAGHDAWIVDRAASGLFPARTRLADVRVARQLQEACEDAELIYHLAAEHRDDVTPFQLYYDVNVAGAQNVCRAATRSGVRRIVFASTVAVYGLPAGEVDERAATQPFNHYGRSKLQAELVFRHWCELNDKRSLTIVRPTVVFGEGNRGNVYNLVRQLQSGRFAMIGSGANRKSLAYVENVAAFLRFVGFQPPGPRVFNYADQPDLTMAELVALISSSLGANSAPRWRLPYAAGYAAGAALDAVALLTRRKFAISRVRIKKFCASTCFSAAGARRLGFDPPVGLEDGLQRFIAADFQAAVPGRRQAA